MSILTETWWQTWTLEKLFTGGRNSR